MALDGAHRTTRNDPDRRSRRWRGHAWWRGVALVYAAVAAVGAAPILRYAVTYWQPCFHNDYDSPACQTIQSHDIAGAFTYEGIETRWLVVTVAAVVTAALCLLARAPRVVVIGVPLLALIVNPLGDYMLTPLVNGGYPSHDAHPASGIPMGAGLALSGLIAAIAALTVSRRERRAR